MRKREQGLMLLYPMKDGDPFKAPLCLRCLFALLSDVRTLLLIPEIKIQ